MSWKNEQKCPTLKENSVALNQSGYAAGGQGCPLPLEKRNAIKDFCLKCKDKKCIYELLEKGGD